MQNRFSSSRWITLVCFDKWTPSFSSCVNMSLTSLLGNSVVSYSSIRGASMSKILNIQLWYRRWDILGGWEQNFVVLFGAVCPERIHPACTTVKLLKRSATAHEFCCKGYVVRNDHDLRLFRVAVIVLFFLSDFSQQFQNDFLRTLKSVEWNIPVLVKLPWKYQ